MSLESDLVSLEANLVELREKLKELKRYYKLSTILIVTAGVITLINVGLVLYKHYGH